MHSPSSSQPMKKHAGKHQGGGEIFSEDDIMMKWTQIRRVVRGFGIAFGRLVVTLVG